MCSRTAHTQAWREAAEAAFAGLAGYIHELNTDVGLYHAVKRTMDDAKVVVRRFVQTVCMYAAVCPDLHAQHPNPS